MNIRVSDETMINVYNNDIFTYNKLSEQHGYKVINNFKIRVYEINNDNELGELKKEKYFLYHIKEISNIK